MGSTNVRQPKTSNTPYRWTIRFTPFVYMSSRVMSGPFPLSYAGWERPMTVLATPSDPAAGAFGVDPLASLAAMRPQTSADGGTILVVPTVTPGMTIHGAKIIP